MKLSHDKCTNDRLSSMICTSRRTDFRSTRYSRIEMQYRNIIESQASGLQTRLIRNN